MDFERYYVSVWNSIAQLRDSAMNKAKYARETNDKHREEICNAMAQAYDDALYEMKVWKSMFGGE